MSNRKIEPPSNSPKSVASSYEISNIDSVVIRSMQISAPEIKTWASWFDELELTIGLERDQQMAQERDGLDA